MAGEILGCTLLTLHNVHFFQDLMRQVREHLEAGDFTEWSRVWIERYESGGNP
jgi:queuine tRNA-ribosyltransferase